MTFRLVREEEPDRRRHLRIVITDPSESPSGDVVTVSLTSRRSGDPPCQVRPGEHPFVAHESYLEATFAKITPASAIAAAMTSMAIEAQADASAQLIERLRRGALAHDETPRAVKAFLRAIGVSPDDRGCNDSESRSR